VKTEIVCPKCSFEFALDQALNRELELALRKTISAEFERKHVEELKRIQEEAVAQASRALVELKTTVETQARQLHEAREHELGLLRAKAELQEEAEKAELRARRTLEQERAQIRNAAQQQFLEEHQLQDADKNKQLEELRRQIAELKHKAEQGFQQLQGAVQEVELEKALRQRFPNDEIEAVRTGARGADLLQKVVSDSGQFCGSILWESKRTHHWSDKWVEKLLEDKERAKADVAVIVTNALPEHVVNIGAVRGVLLTTLALSTCLATALRVNLALLGQTRSALSGQDDEKSRVFQYFLSPEFVERLNSIALQFQQMQVDLIREKTAITKYWAQREKQITTIASTTAKFAGELRGLYGSELPPIPQFDLPEEAER